MGRGRGRVRVRGRGRGRGRGRVARVEDGQDAERAERIGGRHVGVEELVVCDLVGARARVKAGVRARVKVGVRQPFACDRGVGPPALAEAAQSVPSECKVEARIRIGAKVRRRRRPPPVGCRAEEAGHNNGREGGRPAQAEGGSGGRAARGLSQGAQQLRGAGFNLWEYA